MDLQETIVLRIKRERGSHLATNYGPVVREICPRGNNKVFILYFLIHDKCLLFMLELY